MTVSAFDRFVLKQNLVWAWRKAAFLYRRIDGLQSQELVAEFDLDLEKNLDDIARQISAGRYELEPMRLLPQPKAGDGDRVRARQSFQLSVRDQVTWIALINAIGPTLDRKMQPWSYGHRLHRSAWVPDAEENDRRTRIGPYRHSGAQLFRRFRQSWPLYRRHIALTARSLAPGGIDQENLDEGERRVLATQFDEKSPDRLAYLESGYFGKTNGSAYYVGLDLKTFYPSICSEDLTSAFRKHSSEVDSDPRLILAIQQLLDFKVDVRGVSRKLRRSVEPLTKNGPFRALPTGLMVAGFLSNVAMLSIDDIVASEVRKRRIAHFRFVDDHTCVGPDFDSLLSWIDRYKTILGNELSGVRLNEDKFQPKSLSFLLSAKSRGGNKIASKRKLDQLYLEVADAAKVEPAYPRPLLTRTLAQLSHLGLVDFDVLGNQGQQAQIDQLEALLLTDLPDEELRADTRRSYASARLASAVPRQRDNVAVLTRLLREYREATVGLTNAQRRSVATAGESKVLPGQASLNAQQERLHTLSAQISAQRARLAEERKARILRTFNLLLDAFMRHPHKARLLNQAFTFCRQTGHSGLSILFDRIRSFETDQYPTFAYLLGLGFQTLALNILHATREMTSADRSARRKDAAKEFLVCVADLDIESHVRYSEFYLADAARCLIIALEAAAITLEEPSFSEAWSARTAQKLRWLVAVLSGAVGDQSPVASKERAAWLHFAEGICGGPWSNEPSAVWRRLAVEIEPRSKLNRLVLRRYPAVLPEGAVVKIGTASWPLSKRDLGWLYDVFAGIVDKKDCPPRLSQMMRPLLMTGARQINLIDWVAKCESIASSGGGEGAFDPRVSEWTALEILRQIIVVDSSFDRYQIEPVWHPANYTLPISWAEMPTTPWRRSAETWTWENWKAFAQSTGAVRRKRRGVVYDYRYNEDSGAAPIDREQARMVAYGLLLFGLLRRSFALPSIWNIPGQQRARMGLIGANSKYLPISSESLAIIEALARPRSRESVLMARVPGFAGAKDFADLKSMPSDTDLDVPLLNGVTDISCAIENAQRKLESFQVSVMHHRPRQLTPVSVRTLEHLQLGGFDQKE